MLHELGAARAAPGADRPQPAFKMLSGVARTIELLNSAWDVLHTMTPADNTTFRAALGPSSRFQSWQHRLVEFAAEKRGTFGVS